MPMLKVHCVKCKREVSTGFDVDYDTFLSLTHTERTLECPMCDELQVWNLDDVDRSVFKKKGA
jgi:DNA-directed RNA polymerase subunit RPC12/RpoP